MKIFSRIINIVFVIAILFALVAAIGSAITKEPVLLSVIRSNSMHPVWERGDMVVIKNLKEQAPVHIGDIGFFKTDKGSLSDKGWIAHRIVEGNATDGFITKGDANKSIDQKLGDTGAIQREWITAKALTIGETPIVIPKIGFLALWMEENQSNPYLLPVIAIALAILIAVGELKSGTKKRRKNEGMELQLIYMIGGLTIAIIIGATMLASGQSVNLIYEVSEESQGALMGSAVGILQVGDEVSKPLSELSNGGFFSLVGTITTNDSQIKLSHNDVYLSTGTNIETTFTVVAETPGKYDSMIRVGLFYPFLPTSMIYYLANKSYWLALAVVSIIPALPLMLYPFFDRKMRRRMLKSFRKKTRRLQSIIHF